MCLIVVVFLFLKMGLFFLHCKSTAQFCYSSGQSGRHDGSTRDFCTLSWICAVFVENWRIVGKKTKKKRKKTVFWEDISLQLTCRLFQNISSLWDQCYRFFCTWFYWTKSGTSFLVFTGILTLCHKVNVNIVCKHGLYELCILDFKHYGYFNVSNDFINIVCFFFFFLCWKKSSF